MNSADSPINKDRGIEKFVSGYPRVFDFILLVVWSLIVTFPIYWRGIPAGPDMPHHYQFAAVFYKSLMGGKIYPGWGWLTNNFYGDLGVRFYPPLTGYLMAIFRFITGEWFLASVITIFLLFLVSGIGAYVLTREWFSRRSALIAACFYILLPYHANQIYNAFLFGEFGAAAILPFCFLFATRVIRRGSSVDTALFGTCWALLFLTHLPTSVTGSISLGIYCAGALLLNVLSQPQTLRRDLTTLLQLGAGALTALLLSAFYLVRVVTELSLVRVATSEATTGDFSYAGNFILAEYLPFFGVTPPSEGWYIDLLFLMSALAIVPGVLFYLFGKRLPKISDVSPDKTLSAALIILVFSAFMSSPLSFVLWKYLPLIQKVQFPFRWMVIISLIGTIFIAAAIDPLINLFADSKHRYLALLAGGLMLAGILFTPLQTMRQASGSFPGTILEPYVENVSVQKSLPLWLPIGADNSTLETSFERNQEIISVGPDTKRIKILPGEQKTTRIPIFYYPHWQCYSDGLPIRTFAGENGVTIIQTESNAAMMVECRFIEPRTTSIALLISTVGFFGLLLMLGWNLFSNNKNT